MASSSLIHGAWYLPERRELDLLLAGGRRYRYSQVPLEIARGFVAATSKGGYFNLWIRGRFPCRRLGEEQQQRAA